MEQVQGGELVEALEQVLCQLHQLVPGQLQRLQRAHVGEGSCLHADDVQVQKLQLAQVSQLTEPRRR